jgi:hypothetical protein
MIEYPSILGWNEIVRGKPCIAFDKLDGNNIRFGWTRKSGFHKFGTRRNRIDHTNDEYGNAIPLFIDKYSAALDTIFRKNKNYRNVKEITAFCEYQGKNSFAGAHDVTDVMDVVLFDIHLDKQGFIPPREFVKNFRHLGIPKIIYEGNLNQEFINDVKTGLFTCKEGVVCKGIDNKKIWMGKIKTDSWLNKVKARYGEESLIEMGE